MTDSDVIQIDVDRVILQRSPKWHRRLPRFLIRWLEKLICQDKLNEMLRVAAGKRGSDFAHSVLQHLQVSARILHQNRLPGVADRKVIFVSNHPLGGLDGLILIDYVASRYGVEPLFVVNDLLMAIDPLRDVFLPVNKHGAQSRNSALSIDEAFQQDRPVIIFPAGLVSRRIKRRVIADLQWKKMFVEKAKKWHRPVVPLYFDGKNSSFFYNFAKFRKRLGIKFNIEMVRLPKEMFRAAGSKFAIYVGDTIDCSQLTTMGDSASEVADCIRNLVYKLKDE